ncbi:MAG: dienelactone hydrolase family protein [Woeseia sp.]
MTIQTRTVAYRDGDRLFEAYLCWNDATSVARPGVLVAHAWRGRSAFEEAKARQLAELGYVGFALDLFGKGVLGKSVEENRALMKPFMDDRALLQRRMQLAVSEIRSQEEVDETHIAAIGFCFGGRCVLDLARTGADIDGVVSFHGLFTAPGNTAGNKISARVLALHGWEDPMATPEHLVALGKELTKMGADWQIHAYGNTMHAFTNPAANDAGFGTVYQEDADRRSWRSMQAFLSEIFG